MTGTCEMAVIGGGPAGSAFAIALAQAGRDVVLVEREAGPHDKVCGEFLSCEALGYLDALGVDVDALGAVPIDAVSLSCGDRLTRRALPFFAKSLSRRPLDEALLARAAACGATVLRGSAVRSLTPVGTGWTLGLADGREIPARHAGLATGKHDLRGLARPPGRQNDLIGLKSHFRIAPHAAAGLDRTVWLGLFPGGYAGLEPVGGGRANLCLVVRSSAYAAIGRDWPTLLRLVAAAAPGLGALLRDAEPLRDRPLAAARIPYGLIHRAGGPWRLGDQVVVIPSFAGEGMSIALHSARVAAEMFLGGASAAAYHQTLAHQLSAQVGLATRLSHALVCDRPQRVAAAVAQFVPAALGAVASATRIRPSALLGAAA